MTYRRDTIFEEGFRCAFASENDGLVRKDIDGNIINSSDWLTASEASKCVRRLRYEKIGTVGDTTIENEEEGFDLDISRGYMVRGKEMEKWIVDQLSKYYKVMYVGDSQYTLIDEYSYVAGTPDGLLQDNDGDRWVLEIKTTDKDIFEPLASHKMQLSINVQLAHLSSQGIKGGLLVYVNASNWYKVDVFRVLLKDTESLFEKACNKAALLFNNETDILPFEGARTGECRACEFANRCYSAAKSSPIDDKQNILEGIRGRVSNARFQGFSNKEDKENCEVAFIEYMSSKEAAKKFEEDAAKHRDEALRWAYFQDDGAPYMDKLVRYNMTTRRSVDQKKLADLCHQYGINPDSLMKETVVESLRSVKRKNGGSVPETK